MRGLSRWQSRLRVRRSKVQHSQLEPVSDRGGLRLPSDRATDSERALKLQVPQAALAAAGYTEVAARPTELGIHGEDLSLP